LGKNTAEAVLGIFKISVIATMVYLFFYYLNIVPQPVTKGISWFNQNFNTFVFLLCFGIGSFVVLKMFTSRGKRQ
jgi:hypothetical protein